MSMLMRNITLPTGPYDWHAERVPRALYQARLAAFRAVMQAHGLNGAIVSGSTFDDGALAWLTGFTPKLGPAFALVPAEGPVRLLFSGGPGMRPSAQRLTWVEDVAALRGLGTDLAAWRASQSGAWGLCEDAGLSHAHLGAMIAAQGGALPDMTADVTRLRWRCEDAVLPLVRSAAEILGRIERQLRDMPATTRWDALLAAERAAHESHAQDLRLRLSRRAGGPAEPVDPDASPLPDDAALAIALRIDGYWLCARSWRGTGAPNLQGSWHHVLAALTPGVTPAALPQKVTITFDGVGHSLTEPPLKGDDPLAAGQCLRVTLGHSPHALLSALVEIGQEGAKPLWQAAPLWRPSTIDSLTTSGP